MAYHGAFPMMHIHETRQVSEGEAQKILSDYLEAATMDPSLHPNATLSNAGPERAAQAVNFGLVLHNLRRVEAGLRGELITTDPIGDKARNTDQKQSVPSKRGHPANDRLPSENEWQDKSDYERNQEPLHGQIEEAGPMATELSLETGKPLKDEEAKQERKRLKKERRRKERIERERREM